MSRFKHIVKYAIFITFALSLLVSCNGEIDNSFPEDDSGKEDIVDPVALKFDSNSSFKITPHFAAGVNLQYSLDNGVSWLTCTDSYEISVPEAVFFRGSGNTIITGNLTVPYNWKIISDNGLDGIRCTGNIETLLDWETVAEGNHPEMGNACFFALFYDCAHLVSAPEMPAIKLTDFCYAMMFGNCENLRRISVLPQVESYAGNCYMGMFSNCSMLHFVTWEATDEPFFVSGAGMDSVANYMLNGKTPVDNTAYYYVAY